jgi:biotin carboxyl carrier protein
LISNNTANSTRRAEEILLLRTEFCTNTHDTAWLDTLIEMDSHTLRAGGPPPSPRIDVDIATAAAVPSSYPTPVAPPREWAAGKLTQHLHPHTVVLLGALVRAHLRRKAEEKRLRIALGKGQVPTIPADLLQHELAIIYEDAKHRFEVTWLSETNVQLRVRRSPRLPLVVPAREAPSLHAVTDMRRRCGGGGLLRSHCSRDPASRTNAWWRRFAAWMECSSSPWKVSNSRYVQDEPLFPSTHAAVERSVAAEVGKVCWGQVEAMDDSLGLRMHVESAAHGMVTCIIPSERDPRELLAPVTGKLVRYHVSSGALVDAGQAYAEMESMKMVLPLLAAHTGVVHHLIAAGEMVEAGALVATMELSQPLAADKVVRDFDGPLLMEGDGTPAAVSLSAAPAQQEWEAFEMALGEATSLLQGYPLDAEEVTQRLLDALADPGLIRNALQLGAAASGNKLPAGVCVREVVGERTCRQRCQNNE